MPTNAIVNLVSQGWNNMVDGEYKPFVTKSGFNPFGYTKDATNGDILGLGLRGIDAYTTLGMPGVGQAIDKFGTRFAPKIAELSAKSAYIPQSITKGADFLPDWHLFSLAGKRTAVDFGRRSIERAAQEGVHLPKNALRWSNRVAQNTNTGTAYFYRTPGLSNSYDIAIDNAITTTPYYGFGTNLLIQGQE